MGGSDLDYYREDALLSVEDRLNVVRRQLEEVDKVQDQVNILFLTFCQLFLQLFSPSFFANYSRKKV